MSGLFFVCLFFLTGPLFGQRDHDWAASVSHKALHAYSGDRDRLFRTMMHNLGKQDVTQFVVIKELSKLEQGGGIGHGLAAQINADKAAQAGTVVQSFLIRQVKPVPNEVDAQHALQTNGLVSLARFGVVGLDDFTQGTPLHDGIHGLEELVAPRGLAVLLES